MCNRKVKVSVLSSEEVRDSLALLEDELRGGEPLNHEGMAVISSGIESGAFVMLAAREEGRIVGVATLSFRPNISLGANIASIEDFVVAEDARRRGTGRRLLRQVESTCRERGVFYAEVQVEEEPAEKFYADSGFELEGARVMSVSYPFSPGVGNSITS